MVIERRHGSWGRTGFLVTLLTCWAAVASAQPTISLSGSAFPAGPDFATDALSDPWDFTNVLDLDPFPDNQAGWTTTPQARQQGRGVFLNGGRFRATTDTTNLARVSLLFRGWTHVVNTGRTGAFNDMAVPTARYGKLAIKMRYTNPAPAAQGNQVLAAWYQRAMGEPDELSRAGMLAFGQPANGWGLYIVDLQTRQWIAPNGSPQVAPPPTSPFGGGTPAAWESSPLAKGIEFRPQALAGFNVPVEVEWVRLTTRDGVQGAATLTVNYSNCTGSYVLRVSDNDVGAVAVAQGSSSGSGSFTFNYGVLAPGAYTASLTCGNGTSPSQAFTINVPPLVTVIDPDVTGGADFATDVLGNPWDMADAGDVPLIEGVTNPGFASDAGLPALQATGTTTGDPRVTLLNGGLINTGRYRRLTYTLTLDTPFGLSGGAGSLARVLWSSQLLADANSMTNTNDILVWPGRETYTVDLATLSTANAGIETDCGVCPTTRWASRAVRFLRFDPHESTLGVTFRLAQVKLAAPDEVAQGQTFPVRYRFDDPDASSTFSAQIYLDADRDPSTGLRLIGTTAGVRPGVEQIFSLTAPLDLPVPQDYFVYVRVTENRADGVSEARASYAGGPLLLLSGSSQPVVTVSSPAPSSSQTLPFTISGCAYDAAASGAIGVDQVNGFAIAGPGVTGPQANTTQVLGVGAGFGTLAFPVACPSASGAFTNAGFSYSGIDGLAAGSWTLRVMARSTLTGQFITRDVPFTVVAAAGVPQGFTASASGNTVTVAFSGAVGGPPVAGYLVEGATNPAFSPMLFSVPVRGPGIFEGTLGNGTYYLRIVSVGAGGARIGATAARTVIVGPAPPPAPGPPTLQALVTTNPVTLAWAPGGGGTPTSYTIVAGSSPGGSDLAVQPMGLATALSAIAPVGMTVYVRVIAANTGGSATSNEVPLQVTAPQAPGAPTLAPAVVHGGNVTLSWTPGTTGGTPSGYVVRARLPGSPAIIASLPLASTGITVPAVAPGTYLVSVVATNGAGASPESNQVTVTVR
jgi:hypothetical protein